jgi:hypothetical protein
MSKKFFHTFVPGQQCFNVTSSRRYKTVSFKNIQSYRCTKAPIPVATVRICNWFCERVRTGKIDPLLDYFTGKMKKRLSKWPISRKISTNIKRKQI